MDNENKMDRNVFYGAMFLCLILLSFLFCATFIKLDSVQKDIAMMGIGIIGPIIGSLVGFYWGSSKNNKDKDRAIQHLAGQVQQQQQVAPESAEDKQH